MINNFDCDCGKTSFRLKKKRKEAICVGCGAEYKFSELLNHWVKK